MLEFSFVGFDCLISCTKIDLNLQELFYEERSISEWTRVHI